MPSEKYSLDFSSLMFTNGSTAIECPAIGAASASCRPAPLRQTNVLVRSRTTATASTPMIARSSLRAV